MRATDVLQRAGLTQAATEPASAPAADLEHLYADLIKKFTSRHPHKIRVAGAEGTVTARFGRLKFELPTTKVKRLIVSAVDNVHHHVGIGVSRTGLPQDLPRKPQIVKAESVPELWQQILGCVSSMLTKPATRGRDIFDELDLRVRRQLAALRRDHPGLDLNADADED